MKIRGQVVTAAAATAILFTATSGIFLSGGSRASFADPLSPAAISALKDALASPSSDLSSYLAKMDSEQPGSSESFKNALQNNTDTDSIKTAIQNLGAANTALQSTITSALTTLAGSAPSLLVPMGSMTIAVGSGGGGAGGPNSGNPSGQTNLASNPGGAGGDNGLNPSAPGGGGGGGSGLLNPSAPGGGGGGGSRGPSSPFSGFGPNRQAVDPGHNNPGPPGGLGGGAGEGGPSQSHSGPPANPGRGNSRA